MVAVSLLALPLATVDPATAAPEGGPRARAEAAALCAAWWLGVARVREEPAAAARGHRFRTLAGRLGAAPGGLRAFLTDLAPAMTDLVRDAARPESRAARLAARHEALCGGPLTPDERRAARALPR